MRTLIDLPDDDVARLDALATARAVSRANLVRAAVAAYLASQPDDPVDAGFGAWNRDDLDSVAFQRALRDEW